MFCAASPATTIGSTRSRAATIVKTSRLTRAVAVLSGFTEDGSSVVPKLVAVIPVVDFAIVALPVANSAIASSTVAPATKKNAAGNSVPVIAFEMS